MYFRTACFLLPLLCSIVFVCRLSTRLGSQDVPLVTDLELTASGLVLTDRWLAFVSHAFAEGDGALNSVLYVHDLEQGVTVNTRVPIPSTGDEGGCRPWVSYMISGKWLALYVDESFRDSTGLHEVDLNGDADTEDRILQARDLEGGTVRNFQADRLWGMFQISGKWLAFEKLWEGELWVIDLETGDMDRVDIGVPVVPHDWGLVGNQLAVSVNEPEVGRSLNGDGDTDDSVLHLYDLEARGTTNIGLAIRPLDPHVRDATRWSVTQLTDRWSIINVAEFYEGVDLNGDGDTDDRVLHLYDVLDSKVRNLRLAVYKWSYSPPSFSKHWLAFEVPEGGHGEDLNQDGDKLDSILHLHDLDQNTTTNLKLDTRRSFALSENWLVVWPNDTQVGVTNLETREAHDLNVSEFVGNATQYAVGFTKHWLLFGFREGLVVYDLERRQTTDLGRAPHASGRRFCLEFDASGYWLVFNDSLGNSLGIVDLRRLPTRPQFVRGDCNDDGEVDISDAVCILGWLFLGEEEPGCTPVTNTNGDAGVDLSDAVYLLSHLFLGGPQPVAPFPECGSMPEDEGLGCHVPPAGCQ